MPAQIFIALSKQERLELDKAVSSRMTSVRLVARAKAIRMAANNTPSYKIAEHLGVGTNTIGRWRRRYAESRMAGRGKDQPRGAKHGGKQTVAQEALRKKIINLKTPHSITNFAISNGKICKKGFYFMRKPFIIKSPKVSFFIRFIHKSYNFKIFRTSASELIAVVVKSISKV